MRDFDPLIFRATGPSGTIGCGLALILLGLFLLTPVAAFLIYGIAALLVVVGILIAGLGIWLWLRSRDDAGGGNDGGRF